MMSSEEQFEIERELMAAMAQRAGALPAPRVDLRAIRRRTATRRRILVPVIATILALATAAPFALAQSGLLGARPAGPKGGGVAPSPPATTAIRPGATSTTANGSSASQPGSHQAGSGSQAGGQGSKGTPASGAGTSNGGCTSLRAPLTTAERSALAGDAQATLTQARASLASALSKGGLGDAKAVSVGDDLPDRLLPKAGTVVDQVDCAGQRRIAETARTATLDQLRAAVLSTGMVTGVVMERTSGWLGLSAGDLSATAAVSRMTGDSLVMTSTLSSHGLLPYDHTMTVTMRLPDCGVTKVDLRDLGLPGMGLGDLRRGVSEVSGGVQGVVPGILTADATLLSLPTP
jgi:hypothetical protein